MLAPGPGIGEKEASMHGWRTVWLAVAVAGGAAVAAAQRASIPVLSREPYTGAIVVDAGSGEVLFEDRADETCYPASVIKLMDLLLVLEDVERGAARLSDPVIATAEAARMGGSQVYLREHESFSADEMLYALMVQSANDAAVALALWRAGSKEAFVERMNRRAAELGMEHTRFASVHGLPPGKGQQPDVSTARDLARLGRALVARPDVLRYTSTEVRMFRDGSFEMRNHNHLLGQGGCDGLKTGYFKAAGYSILATAAREDRRVVAAVVGCVSRDTRDRTAARLLAEGLAKAKPLAAAAAAAVSGPTVAAPGAPVPVAPEAAAAADGGETAAPVCPARGRLWPRVGFVAVGVVIGLVLAGIGRRRV
jgi:D-alanyl-D-alanine carboxypeptidase (penicillin-binding protein 5/6)